jgi:hypothetical protein
VRGVEPVLGVGGAELARLHNECDKTRSESEQKERIAETNLEHAQHPHIF